MKIDNSIKTVSSGALGSGAARSGKGAAGAPDSRGSGGEHVQLSSLSSRLQSIEGSMANTPIVDSARVAEIRQAIAEGRFKVNPEVVADHLLQTARELLRSRQA